jgi:hypothetical protein
VLVLVTGLRERVNVRVTTDRKADGSSLLMGGSAVGSLYGTSTQAEAIADTQGQKGSCEEGHSRCFPCDERNKGQEGETCHQN